MIALGLIALSIWAQVPASRPASTQPTATQPARPIAADWVPRGSGPWNDTVRVFAAPADSPLVPLAEIAWASSPTVARLPDGQYVAVFEYFSHTDKTAFGRLALSESKDGKSWTSPEPLEIHGLASSEGRPRFPALVCLPGGRLRLYVTIYPKKENRAVIASLISKDRRHFEAEPGRRLLLKDAGVFDPIAVTSQGDVHLFARQTGDPRALIHAVSRDGLRFDRMPDLRLDAALPQSPAIRDGAYFAVRSRAMVVGTNDGANWSLAFAGMPPCRSIAASLARNADKPLVLLVPVDHSSSGPDSISLSKPRSAADQPSPADSSDQPQPDQSADAAQPAPDSDADWPPEPDFLSPIDYVAWLRDHAGRNVTDNAQPYYAQLLLRQDENGHWDSAIAPMTGMWNTNYAGDGAPWRPEDHPDWEQSFQSAQALIAQYRVAAAHDGYVTNVTIDPEAKGPALIGFLLPDLRVHRNVCKEILSGAWRAPDGHVDPDAMVGAWQTTLNTARHLSGGVTLIEDLVGVSVSNLTYADARQALAQGVIPPDRLENALKTLREASPKPRDPADLLAGEAAFAQDMVQYVTDTNTADSTPRLIPERVQEMAAFVSDKPVPPEELDEMLKKDPREISAALRSFYRETADAMRTGYPQVTARQLNEIADRYEKQHPEIAPILPSLSRMQALTARSEASRRATELAYAVNIYKAQKGRWPATLDELPAPLVGDARTDPFTKKDFLYRVGPTGPLIYSASENGKDDGGVHAPRWGDDKEKETASDDFIFWPPQPRNPTPKK